jgi:hypothetical protein
MEKINLEVIIIALITSAAGIIGNFILILRTRAENKKTSSESKKVDVEATDNLTDVALSLINPLKEENARLSQRLAWCEQGVNECKEAKKVFMINFEILWKGAKLLEKQVIEHDGIPVFTVPPFPENGIITVPIKDVPKRRSKTK